MDEWYDPKHRKPSNSELNLVNGLSIKACPHCGHARFKRTGYYRNGTRRYRRLGCGRVFSPLTAKIFDLHKISISELLEQLMHLFKFHSVAGSARDNRNVKNTGKHWISKAFAVLSGCQNGVVYLDETYFSVMPKDEKRKDGKFYRGLSRNKICVATVTDGRQHD